MAASGEDSPVSTADHLDNYSLLDIFELMSAHDLCAVARTSRRFNGLAKIAFRIKYRRSDIHLDNEWTFLDCAILFTEFGEYIKSVRLDFGKMRTDVLFGFIAEFCPNIEGIKCCSIDAMAIEMEKYEHQSAAGRQSGAAPFGQVKVLEIGESSYGRTAILLPNVHLPSLRRLSLNSVELLDRRKVERFFATNNRLTTLHMRNVRLRLHIRNIMGDLVNLEELALRFTEWGNIGGFNLDGYHQRDDSCFSQLKKLTTFISMNSLAVTESIIEAMHAGNVQLKYLEYLDWTGATKYETLVEQMPTIDELRIICDYRMNGYNRLLAFVEENPHLEPTQATVKTPKFDYYGFKRIQVDANAPQ